MMVESGCGSIVVFSATGQAWTETDALSIDLTDEASRCLPIRDVMSTPVVTMPHHLSVHDVVGHFRSNCIRHALVEKNGEIIGLVSLSDVVLCQGTEAFLGLKRLDGIQARPAVVLQSSDSLSAALVNMREQELTAIGVQFADGSYGILTQRDVVGLVASGRGHTELGEICTRPVIGVSVSTSLLQARRVILQHQIRHLAVFDAEERLVHIVGFKEIIQSIEHEFLLELHGRCAKGMKR
jgi:signal-transduction protein with cAMP-binding, CBS, and nucleotidyltransferase domain